MPDYQQIASARWPDKQIRGDGGRYAVCHGVFIHLCVDKTKALQTSFRFDYGTATIVDIEPVYNFAAIAAQRFPSASIMHDGRYAVIFGTAQVWLFQDADRANKNSWNLAACSQFLEQRLWGPQGQKPRAVQLEWAEARVEDLHP